MKKKALAILLSAAMVLSMTACGSSSDSSSEESSSTESEEETEEEEAEEEESSGEAAEEEEAEEESSSIRDSLTAVQDVTPDDSRPNTTNTDERLDQVTYAQTMDIAQLDPFLLDGSARPEGLYETLYDRDGLDVYTPRLASSEMVIVDDTHYQVTIYDYIYDSDGNHITSSDVVFSYEQCAEEGYVYELTYIESVEALDDYTIEFTFTEPLNVLGALATIFTEVYIVSETAYSEHNMATDPVATGPYVVTSFISGAGVTLEARDDYWQTDELRSERAATNVQVIQYDIVGDDSLALVALEEGNSDMKFMNSDYTIFQEGGEYEGVVNLYSRESTTNHTILPNCSEDSVCSDINFRLAVFYAIDSETICAAIGSETKSPCSVDMAPAMLDYQDSWDDYAEGTYQTVYDVELAKEYLAQSSYNGETLVILTESNTEKNLEAQLLQGYLAAIGVDSEIQIFEHAVLPSYQSDSTYWDFLIYSGASNDYGITKWVEEFSADQNDGTSVNFIEDDYLQEMISTCNTVDGYSEELLEEIGEYLIDNAYSYGVFYSEEIYAFSAKFASIFSSFDNSLIFGACEYYLDLD